jgi:excisionase family DNA binding protein
MKSTIRIAATETASLNSTAWFPPPPPPQLMTEREVCAWLNVSKRNLFCWRKAGLIPYLKIGRAVRFRRDEVEKALATRIHNADQP